MGESISVLLIYFLLCHQSHSTLMTVAVWQVSKSSNVSPLTFFSIIVLTGLGVLPLYANFRTGLSISIRELGGILIEIVLYEKVIWGRA